MNKKLLITIGASVLVLILLIVYIYISHKGKGGSDPAVPASVANGTRPTYSSMSGFDYFGNDIQKLDSEADAKAFCDTHPECLGYNSDGYTKSKLEEKYSSKNMTFYTKQ